MYQGRALSAEAGSAAVLAGGVVGDIVAVVVRRLILADIEARPGDLGVALDLPLVEQALHEALGVVAAGDEGVTGDLVDGAVGSLDAAA